VSTLHNAPEAAPDPASLAGLAEAGRIAFIPARLLAPGQTLLAPFAQITHVRSPAYAGGNIMALTAHNPRWYEFTPESWALVLDPAAKSEPCARCGRDWLAGCASECGERIVAAGLAGGWTAQELLAARP
jgi:hypothetical protein